MIHVDFLARYIISILHYPLCSLYLNLFKGLGARIVGEYGGMEKEKKEKENCVKKKMHVDHCCQMAEFWAAGLKNGPVNYLRPRKLAA